MATLLIVGASKGLGKAFVDGLGNPGDTIIGVSRTVPGDLTRRKGINHEWITADFSNPDAAVAATTEALQSRPIDALIYNLGTWESNAFSDCYSFLNDDNEEIKEMVKINLVSPIVLIKALLPALFLSAKPQVILTGSTSGLRTPGRPEVTFGATKAALHGLGDALRESHRDKALAVTTLSLGYLNTDDDLSTPLPRAARRGEGTLIPLHDVVSMVRAILALSQASFVRDLTMPAIHDSRF